MKESFKIFRVGVPEIEKILLAPDEPHSHEYEELILGIEGKIEHFIDFRTENYLAPFICFVTKGKVHRVIPYPNEGKGDILVIRFKSEFIPNTTFHLYEIFHDHANLKFDNNAYFKRMITITELIQEEYEREESDFAIIRQLLSSLFIMIESERKKLNLEKRTNNKTQNHNFKIFLQLLEENYKSAESVEFYANKLFMSSRNLNIICQGILQQSVSEIIETRKLTEAKNLLISTNKTISEIAFEIGFKDKSYFSNVFKRKSGQTPGEFRDEMNRQFK